MPRRHPNLPLRLRDIAELAGVSINTVSRAMNDKPDINSETRARVLEIARRTGYVTNALARGLNRGRTQTIGLLVTDCSDPYYAKIIKAVEATASANDYAMLLATSGEDIDKEKRSLSVLMERGIDGLLFVPVDVTAEHVLELFERNLHTVFLARKPTEYEGVYVGTDNVKGGRLAVEHLIALGHERIARIDRPDRAVSAIEQWKGHHAALADAGLCEDPNLVHRTPPTFDGGRQAALWLKGLKSLPTAVVAFNDSIALGLLAELQAGGIRVPEQISIVGYDNIELASLVRPGLTTIAQPIWRIGSLGAQLLFRTIEGQSIKRKRHLLQPQLIVRDSTLKNAA